MIKIGKYGLVGDTYGSASERDIRWEIFKNGPVVMSFNAPIDFSFYSEGVYVPL